jgi:Xaa-Pro aminopeptidase
MPAQITSNNLPTLQSDVRDGTTDFTRTIHYGMPTDLEKEIYTRLLKGMLAIEATSFPEGTTGFYPL